MGPSRGQRRRAPSLPLVAALAAFVLAAACTGSEDAAPTPVAAPGGDAVAAEEGDPGVFDDRILFGQSAAFTGPASGLGLEMRRGIEAAFHEQNEAGGVHGRMLELTSLDDAYETDFAFANTRRLIARDGVFALIGEVVTTRACRSSLRSPVPSSCGIPTSTTS